MKGKDTGSTRVDQPNKTQEMKKNNDPKTKPQPGARISRMFHGTRPKTPSNPSKPQPSSSTRRDSTENEQSQQPAKPSDSDTER
ncbi:hypothetical protein N7534_006838 [Penicillium rubens]|nr:hypothetical protein N7534_006838 [Penicillium rubens]